MAAGLPPTVRAQPDDRVVQYMRARLRQHTQDSYAGVEMSKFPEDLRVYEHLLWMSAADVVIELGVQFGARPCGFATDYMGSAGTARRRPRR